MARVTAKITMTEAAGMFLAAVTEVQKAQAKTAGEGPYMNAGQAADYMGIAVGTLRNLTNERKVPHFIARYGAGSGRSNLKFRKCDLDALMERIPTLAEVREGMGE